MFSLYIELIYCILCNAQPLQNISDYFKIFQLSGEKVGKNSYLCSALIIFLMATITLRMSAKTDKSTSKHEILMRFRHGAIDQYAKTNIFVNDEYWNGDSDTPISIPRFRLMNDEQKRLIAELTDASKRIEDVKKYVQQSFIDSGAGKMPIPSDWLKSALDTFNGIRNTQPEKERTFFDILDEYIENKDISAHRKRTFKVIGRVLKRYELYNGLNLTIDNITGDTLHDFEKYLFDEHRLFEDGKLDDILKAVPESRDPQPRGENAVYDMMGKLRVFYNWANGRDKSYKLAEPYTKNNPFDAYSVGACLYGTPYYITIDERKQLYQAKLREPLATQRDIFVFQCLIGCRVSDLWSMTKDNIIDGAVEYIPRKTKEGNPVTVRVPLTATAIEILERYKDYQGKGLFPFTSQQEYNRNIKEMFKQAGLNRIVTVLNPTTREEEKRPLYEIASSHLARRTFVGNLYKQVKDPNLICPLSGHVEGSKAFARYRTIDEEMKQQVVSLLE